MLVLVLPFFSAEGMSQGIEMFLKIGDLKGEAQDVRHAGEIEVSSWSWNMGNSSTILTGPGQINLIELNFSKRPDSATPGLMLLCANGKQQDRAVLTLRKSGEEEVEFYRLVLEGVTVENIQTGGSEGGDIHESVALGFQRVGVEYVAIKTDGSPAPPLRFSWDLAANTEGGVTFPDDEQPPPDADGDGLPDEWEQAYGFDPAVNDANRDGDEDGATNYEEFVAGTDPTNANEVLKATLDGGLGTGTLTWSSVAGKHYRVLLAPTLDQSFSEYSVVPSAGDGSTTLSIPSGAPMNFFRIEVVPAP